MFNSTLDYHLLKKKITMWRKIINMCNEKFGFETKLGRFNCAVLFHATVV